MGSKRDVLFTTYDGRKIYPRSDNQETFISEALNNDITFCVGPAGTGKSYMAVALAVSALVNKDVHKIVLCRPAVTAGEKLGFLPGALEEKIAPYLTPLYDALYDLLPREDVEDYFKRGRIELAPLAFMRGRSIKDSFMILDEAQNTTPAQMRMFLTRMDRGSRIIVSGDLSQSDLGRGHTSGLDEAWDVLKNVTGIGFAEMGSGDIVRHPTVKKIVLAYEEYDEEYEEGQLDVYEEEYDNLDYDEDEYYEE